MTNLIPPSAKMEVVKLYRQRLISVYALLWSLALLVGSMLLYPTYLLITGTNAAYTETAAVVSERTEVYNQIVADLGRSNDEAKTIVVLNQEISLSDRLQDVWSVSEQGIEITSVRIDRVVGGIAPIGLTGKAVNRQALALFRDRLMALPYVTEVNLPIENLANNQDITFAIGVVVNPDVI